MGRGGYNGGSTLIGFGRSTAFDPDFDRLDEETGPKRKGKPLFRLPAPKAPETSASVQPVGKKLTRKERRAKLQNIERDMVLAGLNRPLPKRLPERQAALKLLVADKILLQTGSINFEHPVVTAWVSSNGKKST